MMTGLNNESISNQDRKLDTKNRSYKVFWFDDKILSKRTNVDIISLRNPRTDERSRYIITPDHTLFEIMQFKEPFRSWFIDDVVSSNGCLYLTTPVDPLFLAVYYMQQKCSENFVPIDDILMDDDFSKISNFEQILSQEQLLMIADYKESGDLRAYKFNETKTLNWLHFKCKRLTDAILTNQVQTNTDTQCATFVKSEKLEDNKPDDDLLRYAHGLLSEYLSIDLTKKFQAYLGLEDHPTHKRKSSQQIEVSNLKRSRKSNLIDSDNGDDGSTKEFVAAVMDKPKPVEKKVTAKEKALKKAASGAKSITSFFKVK